MSLDNNHEVLKQLAMNGVLNNNRSMAVLTGVGLCSRYYKQATLSMKNLEKLVLLNFHLTLEELAHLFQSCRKLIELRFKLFDCDYWEIDQHLKKPLREGFQRLQICEIHSYILPFSWPVFQEIVT